LKVTAPLTTFIAALECGRSRLCFPKRGWVSSVAAITAICLSGCNKEQPKAPAAISPVAINNVYHFDDTLASASGSQPLVANGTSFVSGKFGKAVVVSKDGILSYPVAGNLDFQNGTIEMWIAPQVEGSDPAYSQHNHTLMLYISPKSEQFILA